MWNDHGLVYCGRTFPLSERTKIVTCLTFSEEPIWASPKLKFFKSCDFPCMDGFRQPNSSTERHLSIGKTLEEHAVFPIAFCIVAFLHRIVILSIAGE